MRQRVRGGFWGVAATASMVGTLSMALPAVAQDTAQAAAQQELAKKLANPVSDLVSVPLQFNWENKVGPDNKGLRTVLNIQPVVPVSITPKWNLIARWIMPYISQPESLGSSSGWGDIVFSAFMSPAGATSLTWGVGPVLLLPMTTDPTLGSGKWGAGPTAVVLRIQGPWVYGMLVNHIWSFADASSVDREEVNQAFIQPFLGYVTRAGVTFTVNSESTATWKAADGQKWTVPVNFLVSKLTKFGPFPFSAQIGYGYYVETPDAGPDWKLRTNFAVLLPRGK